MNTSIRLKTFLSTYSSFQEKELEGRYITYDKLNPVLENATSHFQIQEIGKSFLNTPIKAVKIGTGSKKIMAWSQMHGNEGTTTKAVCDLLRLFSERSADPAVQEILNSCSILFVPMLNPDGAARYTRVNVNKVDLNRDAKELSQPESKVLRELYEQFLPHFCFNLHDQRTIFSAGDTAKPATVSFLSPAMNEERSITPTRIRAMQVISFMNRELQKFIPGQVGRYDDAFNINCTGDAFQSLDTPTILFEAGHFPGDYQREVTRKYLAFSIFAGLTAIASGDYVQFSQDNYEAIPQNQKNFFDIVLRKANIKDQIVDIAIQFEEKLKRKEVVFIPVVATMAPKLTLFGHREIDCNGQILKTTEGKWPVENDIVDILLLNNEKLSIISQDIT